LRATQLFGLLRAPFRVLGFALGALLLGVPGLRLGAFLFLLLSQSLEPLLLGEIGISAAHPDFRTFAGVVGRTRRATHLVIRVMARWAVERWGATPRQPERCQRQTT